MNQKTMQEIFHQQTQRQSQKEIQNQTLQVIGFIIGHEEFAIPILNIQEIVKPLEYTRIPFVPRYVLGVFNLRGNILPLIDLGQKFGLEQKSLDEDMRILVIKHQEQTIGFLIDKLTEAIHLKDDEIDYGITQGDDPMIYGIGKYKDRLITILKAEELLKRDF
ncbi:chemotaxis protein CheW [Helicobacter pametensis]|uniref:chemotaxis protein CheW n=1 Tax=Helicobacter pametensis TaxID=95149 RepID=UPI00048726B2|nr:chemotaxis protein CheW [Helicobacter pametensis]